eukprot:jgi/Tetstr1/448822/TSEL_003790.t1
MSAPSADGVAAKRAVDPGSPPPPSTSSSTSSGSPGASRAAGASPAASLSNGGAPGAALPRLNPPAPPSLAAPPAATYAQTASRSTSPEYATGAAGTTGARAASPASSPRRSTFSSASGPGASQRDDDGVPTGLKVSERRQPRPRGGNRGLALTGLDALARLHSRLNGSGPARKGGAPAAVWTMADAVSFTGVAAGAAWAPGIDAAAMPLQSARVRHHPADVVAFAELAAAWLAKARAALTERHRHRGPAPPVERDNRRHASRARYRPPPTCPFPAGDGVGWGAVDLLSDVDTGYTPAEMSMETARRTDADLFAALLVDIAVALVEDGELSRAAGRLPFKGMGDLSSPNCATSTHPVATRSLTPLGEAERRVAERAGVDNMKEAYLSVLAPSQPGVGISAGDSFLIHGAHLIAEKLGPRAVVVRTDLPNAYNEAWRRTIMIQRHIACSPLHPVIPTLLASRSTDSFLLADDRSAPLRLEDAVQHGALLATASFGVAIHPECDSTLGEASVGLEVRFDKIHAYVADMKAARREALADIEWSELDGHHGIPIPKVPLGSPGY